MPYFLRDQPAIVERVIVHIGLDLRGARLPQLETQTHLSQIAGVSQSTWSMIENGLAEGVRLETLARVAGSMGLEIILGPASTRPIPTSTRVRPEHVEWMEPPASSVRGGCARLPTGEIGERFKPAGSACHPGIAQRRSSGGHVRIERRARTSAQIQTAIVEVVPDPIGAAGTTAGLRLPAEAVLELPNGDRQQVWLRPALAGHEPDAAASRTRGHPGIAQGRSSVGAAPAGTARA